MTARDRALTTERWERRMRRFRPNGRTHAVAAAAAVVLLFAARGSSAEDAVAPAAERRPSVVGLLQIKLPITGNDDRLYRSRVQRLADRLLLQSAGDRRPRLVIEFYAERIGRGE